MSLRKTLANVLLAAVMHMGALSGSITPEEIEKLMNVMKRTKVVHVLKKDEPK
jgi:tellurite resistance protein